MAPAVETKAKSKSQISADIPAVLLGTTAITPRKNTRAEAASSITATNQQLLLSLYRRPPKDTIGTVKRSRTCADSILHKTSITLEQLFGESPLSPNSCLTSAIAADSVSQLNSIGSKDNDNENTSLSLERIFGGLSLTQVLSGALPTNKSTSGFKPLEAKPKIYNTVSFYDYNLSNVSEDILLSMFGAVAQNLFHGASHKVAGTSLLISKSSRKALLRNIDTRDLQGDEGMVADVRTAMKAFNLEPVVTMYACCPLPSCCAIHPPELDHKSGILKYPMTCNKTRFDKVCGSPLVGKCKVINGKSVPRPIRPYAYHHFHNHVAGMLSRSGIEEAIASHMAASAFKDEISDIMSSQALHSFADCDGTPFLRSEGAELRLVWALYMDWYNPYQNKAAGKSVSTGVIAMICLNLPPHLRTLEENIYLAGVIPGPREPSLDAVNQFLLPLINDLRDAYDPGVYFTCTHDFPTGRKSKSALMPVICDTMASKKVTGNCGHGARYFCSRCHLPRKEIENLNISSWPPGLQRKEHEEFATAWQASASATAQNSHVRAHGIRWSALLDLPYWQPSQWTITEGMHILLLGVVPRHCQDLLGLNVKDLPAGELETDMASEEAMGHGRNVLDKALCEENDVILGKKRKGRRTKAEYIEGLMGSSSLPAPLQTERIDLSLLDELAEPANSPLPYSQAEVPVNITAAVCCDEVSEASPIITKRDLLTIQQQISETIRPYWQAQLPQNFGTPEHSKLKADQWRTAIEFDIPVSLVQLLANSKSLAGGTDQIRLCRIMEHTLDLAMAISWGLSRRTSKYHAQHYTFYMHRYLCGIQELFPDYDLKPNHHYALHIQDILLSFGQLHGTWAFSLERLIGRLQDLNTNGKIGEMEVTVLTTFCRRANIRRFVSAEQCPTILQDAWANLKGHIELRDLNDWPAQDTTGSRQRTKESALDLDILQALTGFLLKNGDSQADVGLSGKNAFKWHRHYIKGIQYTDFHTSLPHSLIYFSDVATLASPSQGEIPKPGQIRQIFEHHRICGAKVQTDVFLAIHCFKQAKLAPEEDFFAPFADFRAAIYENDPQAEVEIIRSDQVKCHANRRPWNSSTSVMRAVDREY